MLHVNSVCFTYTKASYFSTIVVFKVDVNSLEVKESKMFILNV